MQNLKILKLDNNLIKTFPENILCLLKLEKLSVCNNLLIKIPENLET